MTLKEKIEYVLEDKFNIYKFQLKSSWFWFKILIVFFILNILGITSFPVILFAVAFEFNLFSYPIWITFVITYLISIILFFLFFSIYLFIIAKRKVPWNEKEKVMKIYKMLKYNPRKKEFNLKKLEQLALDYNLTNLNEILKLEEHILRNIRRDIKQGKYD